MDTIDDQVASNITSPLNIDVMRSRFLESNDDYSVEFPAFLLRVLSANFFILLKDSVKKDFKSTWTQKPDYASDDLYGTNLFWFVLLYVNNIPDIESFKELDYIYAPSLTSINTLAQYRIVDEVIQIANEKIPITEFKTSPLIYGDPITQRKGKY